jgi:hypothetical protein
MKRSILAAFFLLEGVAAAQSGPQVPGYHTHDGLFLRLVIGLGGAASTASEGGDELTISGGGLAGSIAIGAAVSSNLILCAETDGIVTFDPEIEFNGMTGTAEDSSYLVNYLGGGASWYSPSNLFLHGGVGILWLGAKGPGDDDTDWSDPGFGIKGAIGKEWWVGENVAVGFAAILIIGSVPDEGDIDWTTALVNLAFSATFD